MRYIAALLIFLARSVHGNVESGSALQTSTLISQNATITAHTPAPQGSSHSDPCNFANATALLNEVAVGWEAYNVSLLVEKCPSVCILFYSAGNPDISGIGVSSLTNKQAIIHH